MSAPDSSRARPHVVVAGSGFAGLELVLALRALAGNEMRISLISPNPVFAYRPAATLEAFTGTLSRAFDLMTIAADLGVRYHRSRLESVGSVRKQVRLGSGARLGYDTLVLAVGARATAGVPGALTFRDQRDLPRLRGVLGELERGEVRSLVFAVPSLVSWALPLYELALLSAAHARDRGVRVEITIVSPEHRPLEIFGVQASELVAAELAELDVGFVGGRVATSVSGDALTVDSGAAIEADRVVAVPQLRGARIAGVPANRWGFVPIDAVGLVAGMAEVYAAGDMTTFPIKNGGVATQQADLIAHSIAAGFGLTPHGRRPKRALEVRLVGGRRPLVFRIELDEFGQPTAAAAIQSRRDVRPTWTKVFGRYLTPYLETHEPLAASVHARPGA
jgi:sulfide:quinone oxidoreductase